MALTTDDSGVTHTKLAYQDDDSWGLLYNLFGDRVLNLRLFDRKLYKAQTKWYNQKAQKYGVPLDSRHLWTKVSTMCAFSSRACQGHADRSDRQNQTDWKMFAAASTTDAKSRDGFVNLLYDYLEAGQVDAAFPDLYETNNAKFPGRDGQDWNIEFISRPVVGGHFSLLALDVANAANGVTEDPFEDEHSDPVLPVFVDQSRPRTRWN